MEKDEVRRRRREGTTPKTKTKTKTKTTTESRDGVYSVEAVYRDEREDGGSKWIKLGEGWGADATLNEVLTRAAGEMDVPRGALRVGAILHDTGTEKGWKVERPSGEEYEPGMRLREVMAHDLAAKICAVEIQIKGRKRDYEIGGALRNRVNHDGSLRKPNLSEALLESFSARIFKWLWNHSLWSRAALLLFVALSVADYFGFVRANF
eukprot:g2742.t1